MKVSLSTFFQNRLHVLMFRYVPESLCYAYMQLMGKLYYLVKGSERRLIERNIRDMMSGKPEAFVREITKQTFKGIFVHYFEKMFSAFRSIGEIRRYMLNRVTIRNEHLLREALEEGRGAMLVTAHWGAVEFIPWVLGLRGYPVSVILECGTKRLEAALEKRAKYIKADIITCDSGDSVFLRALQRLRDNRLLMTECDEVDTWRKRKSRTIELFGRTLYFDNTLDVLARRSRAPVIGVFLKRVSRRSYALICEPIRSAHEAKDATTTASGTAVRALTLWQKYVSGNPEQWYQWKKWGAMKVAS